MKFPNAQVRKDNTNLAIWQDKNQNGKTDKDKLIKFANLNLLVA